MASTHVTVPAQRLMKDVHMTVTISGLKAMRVRMAIGGFLVGIAARIMGVGSVELKR